MLVARLHGVCDSVENPMDRYCDEPTLAEALSDPVTLAVMNADELNSVVTMDNFTVGHSVGVTPGLESRR